MLVLGSGTAAYAADKVTGTPGGLDGDKAIQVVNDLGNDGKGKQIGVDRLYLEVGGKKITAYCIDIATELGGKQHVYQEHTWDESSVPNLNKIHWILHHSYPTLSVDAVFKAAKVAKPANADETLLTKIVYAGTQTAIWKHSDPKLFALRKDPTGFAVKLDAEQYAALYGIYDYLVKNASEKPEPAPKLEITPAALSGEAGKKIGPFKVVSGGGETKLTATGGKVVDANGNDLTSVADGGSFYVLSDTPGTVTVNASGSGQVPIGRVFIHKDQKKDKKQKIILGDVAGAPLTAQATVTVTPPVPGLPVTGVKLTGAIVAGVLLVTAGAGLLLVRRRRVKFTV